MLTRRSFLQSGAPAAALAAGAGRARAANAPGVTDTGNQDRADHALQRPRLRLWRDRHAPRPPISR